VSSYEHERVNVAVAVADDLRDCLCEVAAACKALGFEPTSTLNDIGVLTGSARIGALPELREVPGVIAVEVERPFRTQALARRRRRTQVTAAWRLKGR
jgi:precorrin-6B methylase 2